MLLLKVLSKLCWIDKCEPRSGENDWQLSLQEKKETPPEGKPLRSGRGLINQVNDVLRFEKAEQDDEKTYKFPLDINFRMS